MPSVPVDITLPVNATNVKYTNAPVPSKDKIAILILIPAVEKVHTEFMMALVHLVTQMSLKEGISIHIAINQQKPWATARNALALEAIKSDYKYVLWLDTDIIFDAHQVKSMLQFMEKAPADVGAITGIYFLRMFPHIPIIYRLNETRNRPFNDVFYANKKEPYEIDRAGLGFCLMHTDVIRTVSTKTNGVPFVHSATESEDMYFFRQMQDAAGLKLYVDPAIILKHGQFDEKYFIKTTKDQFHKPCEELADYLKITPEKAYWQITSAPDLMRRDITAIVKEAIRNQSQIIDQYFKTSVKPMYDDIYLWMMIAGNEFVGFVGNITPKPSRILVLNSGAGNLAMEIAKCFPDARVDAWDRNVPSMEYLQWRLRKHKLTNVHPLFSAAEWKLGEKYDLVCSIIPAGNSGEAAVFMDEAAPVVADGGVLAAVILNSLDREAKSLTTFLEMHKYGFVSDGAPEIYRKEKIIIMSPEPERDILFNNVVGAIKPSV